MPEKENKRSEWATKQKKLIPLARKSFAKGDFKTAKRALEVWRNHAAQESGKPGVAATVIRATYKGQNYEDALGYSYEKLGEFEKAAKRYEEINAPLMAGEMYEREGEFEKAREFYRQASNVYKGNMPRLVKAAENGLARVDNAEENIKEKGFRRKSSRLETAAISGVAVATIIGLVGGMFFWTSNITGNVIGTSSTTNIIGGVLFLFGLVFALLYFKNKKK